MSALMDKIEEIRLEYAKTGILSAKQNSQDLPSEMRVFNNQEGERLRFFSKKGNAKIATAQELGPRAQNFIDMAQTNFNNGHTAPPYTEDKVAGIYAIFDEMEKDLTEDPGWDNYWNNLRGTELTNLSDEEFSDLKKQILTAYRFKTITLANPIPGDKADSSVAMANGRAQDFLQRLNKNKRKVPDAKDAFKKVYAEVQENFNKDFNFDKVELPRLVETGDFAGHRKKLAEIINRQAIAYLGPTAKDQILNQPEIKLANEKALFNAAKEGNFADLKFYLELKVDALALQDGKTPLQLAQESGKITSGQLTQLSNLVAQNGKKEIDLNNPEMKAIVRGHFENKHADEYFQFNDARVELAQLEQAYKNDPSSLNKTAVVDKIKAINQEFLLKDGRLNLESQQIEVFDKHQKMLSGGIDFSAEDLQKISNDLANLDNTYEKYLLNTDRNVKAILENPVPLSALLDNNFQLSAKDKSYLFNALLANPANINKKDIHGRAPIELIAQKGTPQELIKLLGKMDNPRVDINQKGTGGLMPMEQAQKEANAKTMGVLLAYGAKTTDYKRPFLTAVGDFFRTAKLAKPPRTEAQINSMGGSVPKEVQESSEKTKKELAMATDNAIVRMPLLKEGISDKPEQTLENLARFMPQGSPPIVKSEEELKQELADVEKSLSDNLEQIPNKMREDEKNSGDEHELNDLLGALSPNIVRQFDKTTQPPVKNDKVQAPKPHPCVTSCLETLAKIENGNGNEPLHDGEKECLAHVLGHLEKHRNLATEGVKEFMEGFQEKINKAETTWQDQNHGMKVGHSKSYLEAIIAVRDKVDELKPTAPSLKG